MKCANYDAASVKAAGGVGFVPNLANEKSHGTVDASSKRYIESMFMRPWWAQNDLEASE
jgi:hypothetical protein